MALFNRSVRYSRKPTTRSGRGQRVIVIEESLKLPHFMKKLDVLHHGTKIHPLPVKMKFIAETVSQQGYPMAIYACPFAGCNWREGWIQDPRTGKAKRLWSGVHNYH